MAIMRSTEIDHCGLCHKAVTQGHIDSRWAINTPVGWQHTVCHYSLRATPLEECPDGRCLRNRCY